MSVPGTTHTSRQDSAAYLVDGEVNPTVFVDPDIFTMEDERIWRSVWVYVGHTSEVPSEGDYVRRRIGREPVVMIRGRDGEVRVLSNRCPHRGNLVCVRDRGNETTLTCSYHGWSFGVDGALAGVPGRAGYEAGQLAAMGGLKPLPRQGQHRGFVFASLRSEGPELLDQLGIAAQRLDDFADRSPTGELDFTVGAQKSLFRSNWKIWAENSVDNYHANFVHASQFSLEESLRITSSRVSANGTAAVARDLGNGNAELDFRPELRRLGNGFPTGFGSEERAEDLAEYRQQLAARLGAERTEQLMADGPPHVFIFPNLFVLQQDARVIEPVGPGMSVLYNYPAMLRGAPESINEARLRRHENAYGPAGSVLSDDLEMFERVQVAMVERARHVTPLNRGLHREHEDADGTRSGHITDEVGQRGIWKRYFDVMNGVSA